MIQQRLIQIAIAAVLALILLGNTVFVVDQRQQAVVISFGNPVHVIETAGLKLKIPFIENVRIFDKRNQSLEAEKEEIIASDQQRLVVDAFLRYRISNPLKYYQAFGSESVAKDRLERLVNSSLRQRLGTASSSDIVSRQRGLLMQLTRDDVVRRARALQIGVEIVDLRIKRVDLPDSNKQAVFERMKTARQQQAAQIRAEGDQKKREIIASATEEAERTRGEGDAERARIFASSFGKDPSFAAFYRSMRAYDTSLGQGDATLVLSPDSAFLKYFGKGPGS